MYPHHHHHHHLFLLTAIITLTTSTPLTLAAPSNNLNPRQQQQQQQRQQQNIVPKKAGLSGYPTIQNTQAFADLAPYIGWYSDYNPDTPDVGDVMGVPLLWGGEESNCDVSGERLQRFKDVVANSNPTLMFGFFEPDCPCQSSSSMSLASTISSWNTLLAPLATSSNTTLGSPSLCKQFDEDYLSPFSDQISEPWAITSLHINKPSLEGVIADVEHYRQYNKPLFISEFACVFDQGGFEACTDQEQINQFIRDAVGYFEEQEDVVGYGPSNGEGLGGVWPLTDRNGELTDTGRTYLDVVKGL